MKFSTIAETTAPSEILKISHQVRQMAREGATIYNFTLGDFDPSIFQIPKQLEDGIVKAYRDHLTNYPLTEGNLDLRQSIKTYTSEFQGLNYDVNEILVGSGGRPLIYALFLALCDKGDKIVYPVPSWSNNYYAHFVAGDQIIIETKEENNFMPGAEEIKPHIETATLIALCSPQNPTGTVFKERELNEICDMVVMENLRRPDDQKKLYVLFDQMYAQLVYGTTRHFNPVEVCPEVRPYLISVDAISKSFAATGVRVGWCLGPAELINKMKVLLNHIGAWAPMPEQKGLAAFFLQKEAIAFFLDNFKTELNRRLQYMYDGIMQLKKEGFPVDAIAPEAAVFLSIKIQLIGITGKTGVVLSTAKEVTKFLLEEANLAIIPFYAFGSTKNHDWYRLSVGTCKTEEMELAISSLRLALENVRFKSLLEPLLCEAPVL